MVLHLPCCGNATAAFLRVPPALLSGTHIILCRSPFVACICDDLWMSRGVCEYHCLLVAVVLSFLRASLCLFLNRVT